MSTDPLPLHTPKFSHVHAHTDAATMTGLHASEVFTILIFSLPSYLKL